MDCVTFIDNNKPMSNVEIMTEMYTQLKVHPEVVGAGICGNEEEYIVIYLAEATDIEIPTVYKGLAVKTEITGSIYLQPKTRK